MTTQLKAKGITNAEGVTGNSSNPTARLTKKSREFEYIVKLVAKLICTSKEFDELAKSVDLKSWKDGVTDQNERLKIRAELDGMIAHLYGLTEEEFSHIRSTFPIVPEPVKSATLEAYRKTEMRKSELKDKIPQAS